MEREKLKLAIDETKQEILQTKQQIANAPDLRERKILERRLKKLQYLQLWQIGQLEQI
ncbi:MAG: hypothetical protein NUV48_06920 [Peptococcaceae bacterium]|nr:hypothetical protein [Peptococcaceae bacterium]